MNNLRKYGNTPFELAVIHGGPGAAGEMAAVARDLSKQRGVLEPLQRANSVNGQVRELRSILEEANTPVVLAGFSWGSWLSFIVAASYPSLVRKLVLIGAGPFEQKYAVEIEKTRLNRLNEKEKAEYRTIIERFSRGNAGQEVLRRLGELASKADSYDVIKDKKESIDFDAEIFKSVWPEAAELRRSGELLRLAEKIRCPVVAIHGDYDPHPVKGVKEPLSGVLDDFKFHLLSKCGHKPWVEKFAKEEFYKILAEELV
jgi:pimeloyl-ACP methyl ester carboxylesterase